MLRVASKSEWLELSKVPIVPSPPRVCISEGLAHRCVFFGCQAILSDG
jgi:hypothetical protein